MRLKVVGPLDETVVRQIETEFPGISVDTVDYQVGEGDVDALLAWEANVNDVVAAIRQCPSLAWVHTNAAGIAPELIAALEGQPAVLTNGSGAQAPAIAEYVVLALLAFAKRFKELSRLQDRAQWVPGFRIGELRGQTIGIIGLGDVGMAIARLLRPFGVRLLGVRRRPTAVPEIDEVFAPADLDRFLAQIDALVIAAPLTAETRGMIGARELARLRPGAILINVARGAIVDEEAMIAALVSGHLGGAALDVFAEEPLPPSSPLWALPNVIISPHCCDVTQETDDRGLELFLDNLRRYVGGQPLSNVVDRKIGY
jgi:phosphoglycerate dehydrogenase-like enzyme